MKKMILAFTTALIPFSAIADGVPVPMHLQTAHNWKCDDRGALHLFLNEGGSPVLYMAAGGMIGTHVDAKIAEALLDNDYKKLDGQISEDKEFRRVLEFQEVDGTLTVILRDMEFDEKFTAKNCKPR